MILQGLIGRRVCPEEADGSVGEGRGVDGEAGGVDGEVGWEADGPEGRC